MKLKKRMCWCLMLTALCLTSHAQSRIEIKGTDTSAVIPIQQLRIANAKFVELRQCREENDSLYSQVRTYGGLANNLRSTITELRDANQISQTIIKDKQQVIDLTDKELKKAHRKAKFLKLQRNALGGGFMILTGVILVLIK